MTMKFDKDKYVYPCSPTLIPPGHYLLEKYSNNKEIISELKLNGSRCLLYKIQNNEYEFWSRRGQKLKYNPSIDLIEQLNQCGIPDGSIIDCELLHKKSFKNILYFYDVQAWNGYYCLDMNLEERKELLSKLKYSQNIWMAFSFQEDINELFECIKEKKEHVFLEYCKEKYDENILDIIEGLVIKKLNSRFEFGVKSCRQVGWMCKLRLSTKNYSF